jgi:hypothetical protein
VQEIEANIDACLEAGPDFSNGATVLHVVLMLDEIAMEHRLRYDDRNSKVVGSAVHTAISSHSRSRLRQILKCCARELGTDAHI